LAQTSIKTRGSAFYDSYGYEKSCSNWPKKGVSSDPITVTLAC
jgi:hypothetical protein